MAFFEHRFPDGIAQGARGGPRWDTNRVRLSGGRRQTNRNWDAPLHHYNVGQAIKTVADFEVVRAFFYVVSGAFEGFRFKDFADYQVTAANGVLTLISGADYQLGKAYSIGSRSFTRTISKPVAGRVTVYRTRSGSTSDITGASTIDAATGIVTVASHASGDTYAWAGEFDVPVAFENDAMEAQQVGSPGSPLIGWSDIPLEEIRV